MEHSIRYMERLEGSNPFFLEHYLDFHSFKRHWHYDLEILYCTGGNMEIALSDKMYSLTAGEYMIISSGVDHAGFGSDAQMLVLNFGCSLLGTGSQALTEVIFPVKPENDGIGAILKSMIPLVHQQKEADIFEIKGYFFLLASAMLRELSCTSFSTATQHKDFQKSMSVSRVEDYVTHNYTSVIRLEDVARMVNYDVSSFSRVFRECTGLTFHQYLNIYRIERAMALFDEGYANIGDVGKLCGLLQPKTFSRLFQQYTGMTPSEYIRRFAAADIKSMKRDG